MEFTQQDRDALYRVWMSQKAKRHLTQMQMAKLLGMSQLEFSNLLRGNEPLSLSFISRFCQQLNLEPHNVVPSMHRSTGPETQKVFLQNRVIIDGEIQNVQIEGNQVIIDYFSTFDNDTSPIATSSA